MFEALSDKISGAFQKLSGRGKLSEANIEDALKEVRVSLLEADVNFRVVRTFLNDVKERAMGTEVMKSITPGQQFVKIVHEELVALMGGEAVPLDFEGKPPAVIVVVGLQGSGKTTSLSKLALHLRDKMGRKPYLVPADVYRPAAIEQLTTLAGSINVPVHPSSTGSDPVDIAREAVRTAREMRADTVLIDTAGRLQIDDELMQELERIKEAVNPNEILFVADAMTGQEAVNVAKTFNDRLACTGFILTKMDGDARGGAALSIKSVTGKPLKYIGVGEKMDALEVFHPDRIAGRILGMGDVLSLVEKAQEHIEEQEAEDMLKRMQEDKFSLEDFLQQMKRMRKMGPMGDILSMMPGIGSQFKELTKGEGAAELDKQLGKFQAIVQSMNKYERLNPSKIDVSRKRRIANGSGSSMEEVGMLLQQYNMMRQMMKKMNKVGMGSMFRKLLGGTAMEELANEVSPTQLQHAAGGLKRINNPNRAIEKAKAKEKARQKAKMVKKQKKQKRKK